MLATVRTRSLSRTLVLGIALAVSGTLAPARAEEGDAPAPTEAKAPIAKKEIHKFVDAFLVVRDIHASLREEAAGVSDPEQLEALQQTATRGMVQAIEEAALEVERYNHIARRIHAGGDVRERFEETLTAQIEAQRSAPRGG